MSSRDQILNYSDKGQSTSWCAQGHKYFEVVTGCEEDMKMGKSAVSWSHGRSRRSIYSQVSAHEVLLQNTLNTLNGLNAYFI